MSGERSASGLPARGYAWPPFEPGNRVSTKHGGRAIVQLRPRAAEIAAVVAEVVPHLEPVDELVLGKLGLVEARIEKLEQVIADMEGDDVAGSYIDPPSGLQVARSDLRMLIGTALKLYGEIGLTPAARARIWRDAGLGKDASVRAERELERHVRENYAPGSDEGSS